MTQPSFKDIEILTAYLDGQLDAKQTHRLESRLESDENLASALAELRATRALFRRMPHRRAPRNFTLTPKMAGIKPPVPRSYPVLRFASTFAAILLFFAFSANFIAPLAAQQSKLAAAPMIGGIGGGAPDMAAVERPQSGGGCDGCSEPTMEALAPAPAPAEGDNFASPTQTAEIQAESEPAIEPTAKMAEESQSIEETAAPAGIPMVVSPVWMGVLLGIVIAAGGLALVVRYASDSKWRKANSAVPAGFTKREIFFFLLALLLVVAAVVGIIQLAKASAMAQAQPPVGGDGPALVVEDKGNLPPGDKGSMPTVDKGNAPTAVPQQFKLTPEMGYGFSYLDSVGRSIAIDFPTGVVDAEADAMFTPEIGNTLPQNYYYSGTGFSLTVFPKELTPKVPITITFNYTDAEIGAVADETQFFILWWNGSDWVDASTTCATASEYERLFEQNQVRINTCQFGTYIFVGVQ